MTGMTPLPPLTVLLRPLLLGVVTGARSQLGLAVLAWSPPRRRDPAPLRLLRTRAGRAGSGLAVAGELVADKLPRTPSRRGMGGSESTDHTTRAHRHPRPALGTGRGRGGRGTGRGPARPPRADSLVAAAAARLSPSQHPNLLRPA